MPSTSKYRLSRFVAVAIAATAGAAAQAAAPSPTQMSPFEVEAEFGVDGRRIQNSEAVFNQHQLEQHGIGQLQDMAGVAPNLSVSNSDSRGFGDIISLRGSANSIFFSPPTVALYVDDVPSGSVSAYPSTLLNVETFTVKAGPQGTDYGRNASAGLIDIKSRVPGAQHQGSIFVDFGSYDYRSVKLGFDGPLGGKAGYSLSFGANEREGYLENTTLGRSADDRSATTARGALYLNLSDSLTVRLGVLLENVEDDANRLSSLFSPDPFVVGSDLNGGTSIDREQFSLQARQTLGAGTLTWTASKQEWDLDPGITDLDLSALPAASSNVLQNEKLWTNEFRFESTPTADKAQWRAGLFFLNSDTAGDATRVFIVPPGPFVPPGFVQTERTVFAIGQEAIAAYASADYPLSSATILRAGLRVEQAESDIERTKAASNSFGFPSPQDAPLALSQDDTYFSGSLGLTHTVSESLNFVGRMSIAQKPAGYSGFTANPLLARFDDERQWANEVGFTVSPAESRFGVSLLAFWNEMSGYQFERTVPGTTDFVVVNADRARARGVEAKFMWNPVDRVWWDFQAGYSQSTFETHADANGTRVDGNQVPFVPRHTLRTGITVDLGAGWSANASYSHHGRTYFDERNTAMFSQKSYGLVNAQLRYRYERWQVTVYGQNLADEHAWQFINPEIFAGSPIAPRRYGVQLSFTY